MHATLAIVRRELQAYYGSPLAYVFIVIFLALAGALTFYLGNWLERGRADLLLPVAPLALPVPGAGGRDAAVGGGAQERDHRVPHCP